MASGGLTWFNVVNGGLKFGRTWVGFKRVPGYVPRRFGRRSGGQRTPGPWWEFMIPLVGSIIVNRDRTLFGRLSVQARARRL